MIKLAYCDYLAYLISKHLVALDSERLINWVGNPQYDLGNTGELISTAKTIDIEDVNGKHYQIIIKECNHAK